MEQAVTTGTAGNVDAVRSKNLEDFVTFFINHQMFGISVLKVQDILTPDRIAPIPLTPPEIRGSINLRGRIVTVVDVRVRLGLEKRLPDKTAAAAAKGTHRREAISQPAADGSDTADENAHPAQEESPDEASRPDEQGNGAADPAGAPVDADAVAGPAEDANGSADAGERPADDENRPAEGASPPVVENTGAAGAHGMCVTVEHENELYTLLVDRVGDIISVSDDFFEDNPSTLDVVWREFALGVYRLESALMVVLDVGRLLDIKSARD